MAKEFKPPKGKIKVPPKVEEGDETSALQWINENIWKKAKKGFGSFPYTTDLFAAYYCLTDTSNSAPLTPRLAAISAIIYFIWPLDVIPDIILGIGYADDGAVFAAAIINLRDHMTDKHYKAATKKIKELGLK